MEKLPQIVTERLNTMSVAVSHPDADMLTAFTERTLPTAERANVVEHLGKCSECREIVALALPIAEPDQQTLHPVRLAWLTWPVLRWGIIAAGIILVGSFGVLQYQNRQQSSAAIAPKAVESFEKEAKNATPATPVQTTTQENETGASRDKQLVPSPKRSDQALPKAADTAGASGILTTQPSSSTLVRTLPATKTLQHGPHIQLQQNANNYQSQTGTSPAPPPAPARVLTGQASGDVSLSEEPPKQTVSAAAPSVEVQTANLDSGAAPLQSQSDPRQLSSRVERSKPAAKAQVSATEAGKTVGGQLRVANQPRLLTATPASSATWSISSSGALQRSFDRGNSWQSVDVNGTTASTSLAAVHGNAKEAVSDSIKKDSTEREVTGPVFRAVTFNGPDVWAGASGGLLYHSTDAGWHWTRVVPFTSDARLTGDIVSLEFLDLQHGRVVTATPEVWTTTDGGQTWQKQ